MADTARSEYDESPSAAGGTTPDPPTPAETEATQTAMADSEMAQTEAPGASDEADADGSGAAAADPAEAAASTSPIVFVLGSPRSGTSITYYAMREVFGLTGRGEGHVMPVFQRILHEHYRHAVRFHANGQGTLAQSLDVAAFRAHVALYIRAFYEKHYGPDGWVDKTPGAEAILGGPLIRTAFPDARIIVTRRTGIEVIQSYRRKFDAGFEDSCRAWSQCMTSIMRLREMRVPILEVDQYDFTNHPAEVGEAIATHLGQPARATALGEFLGERRAEQSSHHDWTRRLTLADVDWSDAERAAFLQICGDTMDQFDYPM